MILPVNYSFFELLKIMISNFLLRDIISILDFHDNEQWSQPQRKKDKIQHFRHKPFAHNPHRFLQVMNPIENKLVNKLAIYKT